MQQPPVTNEERPESARFPEGLSGRLRTLVRRPSLQSLRSPLALSIAIAVAVNLLLFGAYMWSRGGQRTHLRVEARGSQFTAYIDGRVQAKGTLDGAPDSGGIQIVVDDMGAIPSLPHPRGVDSVRVTDLNSGQVLLADDFSPGVSPEWTNTSSDLVIEDGVAEARGPVLVLESFDHDWRDVALDVEFRNITSASVRVRGHDTRNTVDYAFRPFRHLDNRFAVVSNGTAGRALGGAALEVSRAQVIRSMVSMVLRPYFTIMRLLVVAFGIVVVAQFGSSLPGIRRLRELRPKLPGYAPWLPAVTMAAMVLGITLFLITAYAQRLPHVPDSVSYLFQARILASGHLSTSVPPVQDVFDFFYPPFIVASHGKWASIYPFGQPLLLAAGVRLGAPWLIPPVVAAACVVLMFAVGRRLFDTRTGLLAALLLAGSPFFLMAASDFMSHNTAVFYLLTCLLFLAYADKRPVLFPFVSGIFLGLMLNTRPLSALVLAGPIGVMLLSFVLPKGQRITGLKQIAAFTAGGLLMLVAYYAYSYGTAGDAFAVTSAPTGEDYFGFAGKHSVSAGIENEQTQMALLVLVLNNWPLYVGLALVLLPFVFGTREKWDWFLLASALVVMGAYTAYYSTGVMHGPRYWYEATPFLFMLMARGADRAAGALATAAAWCRRMVSDTDERPEWAAVAVVYGFIVVLVVLGSYRWLYADEVRWRFDAMPARARDLKGFNGVDDRLAQIIDDAQLEDALVLVEPCPNWQCYGPLFWKNSPGLDGNIVYAKDVEKYLNQLFAKYPDRQVYVASWPRKSLVAYGDAEPATPAALSAHDKETAPRAREISPVPTATPIPTSTPDIAQVARRDEQRRSDLNAIAAGLQQLFARDGSYPKVGIQTLCTYPGDSGCALKDVIDIPMDPLTNASYWYESDGRSFVLYAQVELPPGAVACPGPIPGHLKDVKNLICLKR